MLVSLHVVRDGVGPRLEVVAHRLIDEYAEAICRFMLASAHASAQAQAAVAVIALRLARRSRRARRRLDVLRAETSRRNQSGRDVPNRSCAGKRRPVSRT